MSPQDNFLSGENVFLSSSSSCNVTNGINSINEKATGQVKFAFLGGFKMEERGRKFIRL